MNLNNVKTAYFIGIKGVGMTALAQIFKARGMSITGSDTKEKFFTDEVLQSEGIKYHEGFDPLKMPKKIDLVVYSTAYSPKNPEMVSAKKRELKIISMPEALGLLYQDMYGIAVCGSHGKTTISALLGYSMVKCGFDPTAWVGSKVIQFNGNARIGKSKYLVTEADEYQNKLQYLTPRGIILNNIDWDHPDYFPDEASYIKVFRDFVKRIPKEGFICANFDDKKVESIVSDLKCNVISYGLGSRVDYSAKNISVNDDYQTFDALKDGRVLGVFKTQLIGRHNIMNCLPVIAILEKFGADMEQIKTAIEMFKGTARRFERVGEYNGALIIDDYAHHPTEVKATIKGARDFFKNKKIWIVFHPHTFSRTKALFEEFSQSFDLADHVIVIDIYGSAREAQGDVHSSDLVKKIKMHNKNSIYLPKINDAVEYLSNKLKTGDVLITMGAGNVWEVGRKLVGGN